MTKNPVCPFILAHNWSDAYIPQKYQRYMNLKQSLPEFELCPFPKALTITPRMPMLQLLPLLFYMIAEALNNPRFFQQCPAYLVCLTWMVFEMGGKWPYSCSFVKCCFQDLFKTPRSLLVKFLSTLFSIHFINALVVHLYSSTNTATTWKKSIF